MSATCRSRCRISSRTPAATTLRFLELFRAAKYEDVSLTQWMALTPHELVQAHLNLDRQLLDGLPKDKRPVV